MLPKPSSRLGKDFPLPIINPFNAYSTLFSAPAAPQLELEEKLVS